MTLRKAPNTSPDTAIVRGGLMRSGLVVSAMTMLSRVMGLARDVIVATLLGAGDGADAFFVAFKIPNFLRQFVALRQGVRIRLLTPLRASLRCTVQEPIMIAQ